MSDPLRRALDRLVTPHREPVFQEHGAETRIVLVTAPGLLQQLRAAVVGGTGAHAGGASGGLDSSRLPFDAGAAGLLDAIARTVAGWSLAVGLPPQLDEPEAALEQWYRAIRHAYLLDRVDAATFGAYVRAVLEWVDRIEQLFAPPRRVPLAAPCPACGERWAHEPSQGDRVDALLVELRYRDGGVDSATAACRFCGASWHDRDGLIELMGGIADAEGRLDEYLVSRLIVQTGDTGPIPLPA